MKPPRALILLVLAAAAHAQDKPALVVSPNVTTTQVVTAAPSALDASVTGTIEQFFKNLQEQKIEEAYDQLTKGTKIAEKTQDVTTLKEKTRQAVELFGEITGAEQVDVEKVGTRLLSATYLSLGKSLPLRWRFYFYKGEDVWRLIDIRVDDRLMDMFGAKTVDQTPTNWPRQ